MFVKILFLVIFFAVMLAIGIYCRRHASDVNGFVLGGRSVGPWLTAFAYGTSYFSAVIFIGYAGQFGWEFGLASTWIGLGNAFIGSLLAWNILGRRTRVMSQHLGSATMPDFFGKRFGSSGLKLASSVIIFIFLIPYTASLYNGLSRLFNMAFSIDYVWCVLGMAALTGAYVLFGGYMATAINDFLQGLIMLVGIVVVVVAVLKSQGGLMEAIANMSAESVTTESGTLFSGAFTSFFGPDLPGLIGVILLTSLGTWGLPQMIGKFYTIKNEAAIHKGTVISTLFALVVAGGCYFLGGFGRLFADSIEYKADGVTPIYDSIIPTMLEGLSPVLIALVVILVLSASMSTLSSLVLTSGSTLTLDFIVPMRKKPIPEQKQMLIIRLLIVFFIAISAAIAIYQIKSPSVTSVTFIAQLMGVSWGALAGAFMAPFLYGLYMKRVSPAAVWVCFISGVLIMSANLICNLTGHVFFTEFLTSPINAGVLAMLVGLILVPVVSFFTPSLPATRTEQIFACYGHEVTVEITDSLGK